MIWFARKRNKRVVLITLLFLFSQLNALAWQANAALSYPKSVYIIEFKAGTDAKTEARNLKASGIDINAVYSKAINGLSISVPDPALSGLMRNPNILGIYPEEVATLQDVQTSVPSWGLDRVDQRSLPLNSKYIYDSKTPQVKIYIFDTGLDSSLPEFDGRIESGINFMPDKISTDTSDCNGHGTHVAGTSIGTNYGIAKTAKVIPIRVLDCNGSGTATAILSGIDWAISNHISGPAVANMSLGFSGIYSPVDTAVQNLINDGITTAIAAGNSNKDACNYTPARVISAITVGATTSTDSRASFSNYGKCVDIFAPGSSITSVTNGGVIASWSGTSMASPHVAGAAALILAKNYNYSPSQVASKIINDSTPGLLISIGTGSPNRLLYISEIYTITFNYNDAGATADTTQTINQGSTLVLPTPNRTGYTLNGWYSAASGGTLIGAGGATITPGSTTTYYAQWSANPTPTYTITFNYNDAGATADTTQTINQGSTLVLPTPNRTGYTLNGWYSAASGGTLIGAGGATITPGSTTTYYAQWSANPTPTYTITFNYNDAGATADTTQTINQGSTLVLPTPNRTGYTLNGWYSAASGGTLIGAGGATITPGSTTTYYAQWISVPATPVAPILTNLSTTITTTWSAPNNGGSPITSYILFIYRNSVFWKSVTINASTFTYSMKVTKGSYRTSLFAVNSVGSSNESPLSNTRVI